MKAATAPTSQKTNPALSQGLPEDFILGEKPGKGEDSREGQGADEKGPVGPGHVGLERAHLAHVQLSGQGVHHASRPQEEQGFEEGMGHQMEDPGGESRRPRRPETCSPAG